MLFQIQNTNGDLIIHQSLKSGELSACFLIVPSTKQNSSLFSYPFVQNEPFHHNFCHSIHSILLYSKVQDVAHLEVLSFEIGDVSMVRSLPVCYAPMTQQITTTFGQNPLPSHSTRNQIYTHTFHKHTLKNKLETIHSILI